MDFYAIQFFLFLYFIRPQDWIAGLAGAHLVMVNMLWAISATIFRPGGISLNSIVKTPHDWAMLIYFGWVVWNAPDPGETFQDAKSLLIFYFVTMLAVHSWDRMLKLLSWWTVLLLIVAGLGVGSLFGIDLTGAVAATTNQHGRLSLNTWMLDNPNALGHTVIVAIPLIYFAFVWKRGGNAMLAAPLLMTLAGTCVYYTESKGAFLVGAATLAASQIFGRPRITQIIIICLALTLGTALVTQLPRMQTLSRSDEGIQGRLLAWEDARNTMIAHPYGVGWKNFTAHIRWNKEVQELATHGSYVQIGAALGYGGLFLYLGVLYCGFRTVFQAKTRNDDEERVRRMLFCLLFSYTISNWMIDRAYHTEFFVISAAIAAFHRLCRQPQLAQQEDNEVAREYAITEFGATRITGKLVIAGAGEPVIAMTVVPDADSIGSKENPGGRGETAPAPDAEADRSGPQIVWSRIGVIDIAITALLLWGVISLWDYILKSF